ncbi:MAG: hypothetical protein L3J37_02725 [Rhodobacteraceae bacterium]|nr:hypothetical protein [Paracoccaceae bacterium]
MTTEMINARQLGISRQEAGAEMLLLHCALARRGALLPLMARLPILLIQGEHSPSVIAEIHAVIASQAPLVTQKPFPKPAIWE